MQSAPDNSYFRNDAPHSPARNVQAPRPTWQALAHRFSNDRECLASYLAMEAAEVIGGAKPANLINLVDRERSCGRNLYRLWRRYGQQLLVQAGLSARELVQRNDGVLLLIFQPEQLADYLATQRVTNFLHRAGYCQPSDMSAVLDQLSLRFHGGQVPHEVGVILGYPLKDVAGFMGWVRLPVTGQGPWKIYGDLRPSLAVVDACRRCQVTMANRLCSGDSPVDCLQLAPLNTFSSPTN